jgi:hypothetical protein
MVPGDNRGMKTLQKTGRTGRMLEEALRLQAAGKSVIIMMANHTEATAIKNRLGSSIGTIKVESITGYPRFDWNKMEIPGMGSQFVVLVDHSAIEGKFGMVLDTLHRFDEDQTPVATEVKQAPVATGKGEGFADETPICDKAPAGWQCTRTKGHTGPCAAQPAPGTAAAEARARATDDEEESDPPTPPVAKVKPPKGSRAK